MIVLQDWLETEKRGKPVYYCRITCDGLPYTEKLDEAEKFSSEQEAYQCYAFDHPFCFFEPVEVRPTK